MAVYRYRAQRIPSPQSIALLGAEDARVLTSGKLVSATMEANSAAEIVMWLEDRSYRPISVRELNRSVPAWARTKPDVDVYLMFYRGLAALLKPGSTNEITKRIALATMTQQISHPSFREVVAGLEADVERGDDMGTAMKRRPHDFEPLHAALISAGEQGGAVVLHRVLKRIVEMLVKGKRTMGKVVSAVIEPAITLLFLFGLILFFIISVAPMLKNAFKSFNTPVPASTQFFIDIGTLALNPFTWIVLGLAIVGAVVGYRAYAATDAGMRRIDRFRLYARISIPLVVRNINLDVGALVRHAIQARILRMLGTLMSAGVSVASAIDTCIPLAGSPLYADALREIRAGRELGDQLPVLMRESGVFEPIVVEYLAVAAKAADIELAMIEMAEDLEESVALGVDRLTEQIRPLLVLVTGALAMPVVIAMFVPFYTLGTGAAN